MVKRFFIEQTTGRVFTLPNGSCVSAFFRWAQEQLAFEGMFGTGTLIALTENAANLIQYVERRAVYSYTLLFHEFNWYDMDNIVRCEEYTKHLTLADYRFEELTAD